MDGDKVVFDSISVSAFTKLLCCVYLGKYEKLFKHVKPTPPSLFEAFQVAGSNMSADMVSLLTWLGNFSDKSKETHNTVYCSNNYI